jgi:chromate reductase
LSGALPPVTLRAMNILGLSGSLRSNSSNTRLLRAAAGLAPPGVTFTFYDEELAQLPAFNPDLDGEGATPPPQVAQLRQLLAAAKGVLLCCPEYAHGVPGAFKNALDWTVSSGEFTDKPVVMLMASPSGARQALAALEPTLRVLGARLLAQHSVVLVPSHLDAANSIRNAAVEAVVRQSLDLLVKDMLAREN